MAIEIGTRKIIGSDQPVAAPEPDRIVVKVFSATMHKERDQLGEIVTAWIRKNEHLDVTEIRTLQSSDHAFHCVTFVVFAKERAR